jgi:hypothetical protein
MTTQFYFCFDCSCDTTWALPLSATEVAEIQKSEMRLFELMDENAKRALGAFIQHHEELGHTWTNSIKLSGFPPLDNDMGI